MQQPFARSFAVAPVPGEQVAERERLRHLHRPHRRAVVAPPLRGVPFAVGPGRRFRCEGRLEVLLGNPDQFLPARFLRSQPRLAEHLHFLRPHHQPGVPVREPLADQLLARTRERLGVRRDRKPPRLAPPRPVAPPVKARVAPPPCPGAEGRRVRIQNVRGAKYRDHFARERAVACELHGIGFCVRFRQPGQRRRIRPHRRPVSRQVADIALGGSTVGDGRRRGKHRERRPKHIPKNSLRGSSHMPDPFLPRAGRQVNSLWRVTTVWPQVPPLAPASSS